MKNRFFSLLLLILVGTSRSNDDAAQLTLALTQIGVDAYNAHQQTQQSLPNEKNFRKMLYWMSENNPFFYKLDVFKKDFDYYVTVLARHIETLEHKIALKQSGLESTGMGEGLVSVVLAGLCGYTSYYFFNARKALQSFEEGRYADLTRPQSLILMLSTVTFGLLSAIFASTAGTKFYKVYRYADRLIERLERDKKLLALLEQEKNA